MENNYITISELSKYLDSLNLEQPENIEVKIPKRKEAPSYPVSSAQRRLFYTVNMETNNLAYNTPFGISFSSKPDINKLENCIKQILNSHDAFKTYFELENGDVVQKLVTNIDFHLDIKEFKNDNFIKPFDLAKAPLIHIELDHFDDQYLLQLDHCQDAAVLDLLCSYSMKDYLSLMHHYNRKKSYQFVMSH